jgi:internalin A
MADTVLMFCAPNYQNLDGIHEMVIRLMNPNVVELRGGRPLKVIVIPARVERSDSKLLDDFKLQFLETFKEIVFPSGLSAQSLWELGISYWPKYALAELVAIREEREANLASAEKLALEIRQLGAMLVYIKEGDQSILDDICKKIKIQPEHISFDKFGRLTELVFSSPMMAVLPPEIGKFTQLNTLTLGNIEGNSLKILPPEIGYLSELNKLSILGTKISVLPSEIAQLTKLTSLGLNNNNNLKKLPEWIGQLTNLTNLDLGQNNLRELPEWIGQLTNLTSLDLGQNSLSELPEWMAHLTNLTSLDLGQNDLRKLPMWLGQLTNLTSLNLSGVNLIELPQWISQLTNLVSLNISNSNLTNIPEWLTQLKHLEVLYLDNNPLNPALQSAYNACEYGKNYKPLWAYLRSLEQNAEPLYEAKLVLVGEGNVGKTTLLKALKGKQGEAPQEHEPATHGLAIDIHGLRLPHPAKDDIEIQLNAWEFGGQDVYRVTHQFFFSRRSLYLLVWEPRRGVQQSQVEDWLNMIRLRVGDEARVIIVSTHCTMSERITRIDKPVFKQQYGDIIVGFHEVDCFVPDKTTGEMVGIAELKKVIASEAAKLKHMGMGFNRDWKAARDELLQLPEPRIAYSVFGDVCAQHGLSEIDTSTLARLMNDLGYIVHYADDEKLHNDVVLKPEWLTKAIGFVLENRATAEREGILPDSELYKVWHDHAFPNEPRYAPEIYPFFLRLMEKYDVCYRLTDGKASLVAQHVPQVRPELPWLPEQEPPKNLRRIAMVCAMEEDPPGLVPWMIVRTHDYAVYQNHHYLHWQKGMFLSHSPHGEAVLVKRGREFHIYVQAVWPEYFMNVLQNTLQKLIDDNWPGLKDRYRFMVPCPEIIDGQSCKGRFNIHSLRQFLAEGDSTVRCQECSNRLSIVELLFGFEERDMSLQLHEINERLAQTREQISGFDSRIANYFMATMRSIADESKNGPRLFTFRPTKVGITKQLFSQPLELQLWCEAEGCQHPVIEKGKGVYLIENPQEWVTKIAPYANYVLSILKTVTPIAAPAVSTFFSSKTTDVWDIGYQLDLSKSVLDKLPSEIKSSDRQILERGIVSDPERSGILALHRFLNEVDPSQANLGLHRVPTYTGDYRWLCRQHYDALQPNIPDVIQPPQ